MHYVCIYFFILPFYYYGLAWLKLQYKCVTILRSDILNAH